MENFEALESPYSNSGCSSIEDTINVRFPQKVDLKTKKLLFPGVHHVQGRKRPTQSTASVLHGVTSILNAYPKFEAGRLKRFHSGDHGDRGPARKSLRIDFSRESPISSEIQDYLTDGSGPADFNPPGNHGHAREGVANNSSMIAGPHAPPHPIVKTQWRPYSADEVIWVLEHGNAQVVLPSFCWRRFAVGFRQKFGGNRTGRGLQLKYLQMKKEECKISFENSRKRDGQETEETDQEVTHNILDTPKNANSLELLTIKEEQRLEWENFQQDQGFHDKQRLSSEYNPEVVETEKGSEDMLCCSASSIFPEQNIWVRENIHKFQNNRYETDWQLMTLIFNDIYETRAGKELLMSFWEEDVWEQNGRHH